MPADAEPGTRDERELLDTVTLIYYEQYGDDLPTDVPIHWRDDGSPEET